MWTIRIPCCIVAGMMGETCCAIAANCWLCYVCQSDNISWQNCTPIPERFDQCSHPSRFPSHMFLPPPLCLSAHGQSLCSGQQGEICGGQPRKDLGLPGRAHVPGGSTALPASTHGAAAADATACCTSHRRQCLATASISCCSDGQGGGAGGIPFAAATRATGRGVQITGGRRLTWDTAGRKRKEHVRYSSHRHTEQDGNLEIRGVWK